MEKEVPKTYTNWSVFEKALVRPTEIVCQSYHPIQRVDISCHSRLTLDPLTVLGHNKSDHGTGYHLTMEKGEKPWPGWSKFQALGIEIHDFRCDVCDEEVRLHPQYILKHMRPHSGKIRRITPGGRFNITLDTTKPMPQDADGSTED